jgi:hypothetical protein
LVVRSTQIVILDKRAQVMEIYSRQEKVEAEERGKKEEEDRRDGKVLCLHVYIVSCLWMRGK